MNEPRAYLGRWMEYIRFGTAGVLNTCTDFAVLNTLLGILGSTRGGSYVVCKALSFLAAMFQSYFLNKYWVFGVKSKTTRREAQKFFGVSVMGFFLNIISSVTIFHILTSFTTTSVVLKANAGAVFGTLVVLAWNYFGYKFFVFTPLTIQTYEQATKKDT